MTVTEANAINSVLRWLLGTPGATGGLVPDEEACNQAAWLADRANRAIWAGLNGDKVRELWPSGGGLPL